MFIVLIIVVIVLILVYYVWHIYNNVLCRRNVSSGACCTFVSQLCCRAQRPLSQADFDRLAAEKADDSGPELEGDSEVHSLATQFEEEASKVARNTGQSREAGLGNSIRAWSGRHSDPLCSRSFKRQPMPAGRTELLIIRL